MHPQKRVLIWTILAGGMAVLGSYAWGILYHPAAADILWGGVPAGIRPYYTAGMLLGAAGFFAYTAFILFHGDEAEARRSGWFSALIVSYLAILLPSALWLPLTFLAARGAGPAVTWMVRLDLYLVAFASLHLWYVISSLGPRRPLWAYRMAQLGCAFFCFQTVIMDALVWGSLFHA